MRWRNKILSPTAMNCSNCYTLPYRYALYTLTKRINHSESYSDGEACTNQAESFFARLRRAEMGVHHRISGVSQSNGRAPSFTTQDGDVNVNDLTVVD